MSLVTSQPNQPNAIARAIRWLHRVQIGGGSGLYATKIPKTRLASILRLMQTLLENGLSLPKTLSTLADDKATRKYRNVLLAIRQQVETGGSLSDGFAKFPRTFSPLAVQQIRMGEKCGGVEQALDRICTQLELSVMIRKKVFKKLSYPLLVVLAGSGLVGFMLAVVVPQFEDVYAQSKIDLPLITRITAGSSRGVVQYGWLMLPVAIGLWLTVVAMRHQAKTARWLDECLLRVPLIGGWIADASVLSFIEAMQTMVTSGYMPIEAITAAQPSVRNRAVRAAIEQVRVGVIRGQRLSTELAKHERFFSSTFCQLVHVGEQSGDFAKALNGACQHLRNRLENRIDTTLGLLEPSLTILLASAIGTVVLSIYMPMFRMYEVLE
jgi:type II secretory pathway component PulF